MKILNSLTTQIKIVRNTAENTSDESLTHKLEVRVNEVPIIGLTSDEALSEILPSEIDSLILDHLSCGKVTYISDLVLEYHEPQVTIITE